MSKRLRKENSPVEKAAGQEKERPRVDQKEEDIRIAGPFSRKGGPESRVLQGSYAFPRKKVE